MVEAAALGHSINNNKAPTSKLDDTIRLLRTVSAVVVVVIVVIVVLVNALVAVVVVVVVVVCISDCGSIIGSEQRAVLHMHINGIVRDGL